MVQEGSTEMWGTEEDCGKSVLAAHPGFEPTGSIRVPLARFGQAVRHRKLCKPTFSNQIKSNQIIVKSLHGSFNT